MKLAILYFSMGILCFSVFLMVKFRNRSETAKAELSKVNVTLPTRNGPKPAPSVTKNDLMQYYKVRVEVLNSHHALQVEYKDLIRDMDAHQAKINEDIIRIDPSARSVIAKLTVLKTERKTSLSFNSSIKSTQASSVVLPSPSEIQKLNYDYAQVLNIDPELRTESNQFPARTRAFEERLNAEIIESNPNFVTLVNQLNAQNHLSTQRSSTTK